MLPFVYIGDYPFPMYSVMALCGAVFVVVVGLLKRKAFGLRKRDIIRLVAYAALGGILGAKLFSVIGQLVKHGGEIPSRFVAHM
jgi:prolipoprotein diacylglyceryltransferase